ncbi:hypothetical protein, partial [Planomonospora alba]|uniref:hypothetical protein n=1 Tax=Planomonospora alba TaxID=161354 RepID=UPI0031F13FCC
MQAGDSSTGRVAGHRRGRSLPRLPFWSLFLLLGCVLTAVVVAAPDPAGAVLWEVVPVAAVAALAAGIRRHRPPAAAAWRLITAGVAVWAAADLLRTGWYLAIGGDAAALPLWLDLLYVPMYPLVVLGLNRLARAPERSGVKGVTLDAVVIVLGAALMYWTLVFQAFAGYEDLRNGEHLMTLLYLTADLAVVFAGARLWFRYGTRNASYRMLSLSLVALLVADAVYAATLVGDGNPGMAMLHGSGAELAGGAAWMLWLVLTGTAALHPAVAETEEAVPGTTLTLMRGGMFLAIACGGPLSLILSVDTDLVTVRRFDLVFPLLLLTGMTAFLIVRLVAATGTAQRRARQLDEQAAELSRA